MSLPSGTKKKTSAPPAGTSPNDTDQTTASLDVEEMMEQIKVLSEQMNKQNAKIADQERKLVEQNEVISKMKKTKNTKDIAVPAIERSKSVEEPPSFTYQKEAVASTSNLNLDVAQIPIRIRHKSPLYTDISDSDLEDDPPDDSETESDTHTKKHSRTLDVKSIFTFPVLEGRSNYRDWEKSFGQAIYLMGLDSHFIKEKPRVKDRRWKRDEIEACLRLGNMVNKRIRLQVSEEPTAWLKMDAIRKRYKEPSAIRENTVITRWSTLKMKNDGDYENYLTLHENFMTESISLKIGLPTKVMCLWLIGGLPTSWSSWVESWKSNMQFHKRAYDWDDLVEAIRVHGEAKTDGNFNKRNKNRDSGDVEDTKDSAFATNVKLKDVTCYNCNKKGHYSTKCKEKKKEKGKGREGNKDDGDDQNGSNDAKPATADVNNGNIGSARKPANKQVLSGLSIMLRFGNTVDFSLKSFANSSVTTHNVYLLDSGCSNHLCGTREDFWTYEKIDNAYVEDASGKVTKVMGKGSIKFEEGDGAYIFGDVYHLPGFANLISLGQLTKKGITIAFIPGELGSCGNIELSKDGVSFTVGSEWGNNIWKLGGKVVRNGYIDYNTEDVESMQNSDIVVANAIKVSNTELAMKKHQELGHTSFQYMKSMVKDGLLDPITTQDLDTLIKRKCLTCVQGKSVKRGFPTSTTRSTRLLELIHTDLSGPFPFTSFGGSRYILTFIDDYSRWTWTYPIPDKRDIPEKVEYWISLVENQHQSKVSVLRMDNGGEYVKVIPYLMKKGIQRQTTIPHTSPQNGVAERKNLDLQRKATCMLLDAGLPGKWWAEAISCATWITNRSPTKANNMKSPFEVMYGNLPDLSMMRHFGRNAEVLIKPWPRKTHKKTKTLIFVGYADDKKAWLFLNHEKPSGHVYSRDANFIEEEGLKGRLIPYGQNPDPFLVEDSLDASPEGDFVAEGENIDFEAFEEDEMVENVEIMGKLPHSEISEAENDVICDALSDVEEEIEIPNIDDDVDDVDMDIEDVISVPDDDLEAQNDAIDRPQQRWVYQEEESEAEDHLASKWGKAPGPPPIGDNERLTRTGRVSRPKALNEHGYRLDDYEEGNVPKGITYITSFAVQDAKLPESYDKAIDGPDREHWKAAMNDELGSLAAMNVWEEQALPTGRKAVGCRWVFAIKKDNEGNIIRYKARLVAQGFAQIEGIDFSETYSPVARMNTSRIFFTLANQYNLEMRQADFVTAYLNGDMDEELYMKPPPGINVQPGNALRIFKSLYGFKQSARTWYLKLDKVLKGFGFAPLDAEPCLYVHPDRSMVLVYVDDLALACKTAARAKEIMDDLSTRFKMEDRGDMIDATWLGIHVKRDRFKGIVEWGLKRYIEEAVERFDQNKGYKVTIPLPTEWKPNSSGLPTKNSYLKAVGTLMYIATAARPDISYAVGVLARYNAKPTEEHWNYAMRVFRYLRGTSSLTMKFTRGSSEPVIEVFSDADHAGDEETRISTSGCVVTLFGSTVIWLSRKQRSITKATIEAEYVASSVAAQQMQWVRMILKGLNIYVKNSIPFYIDNQGTVGNIVSGNLTERTKHIDIAYKMARDMHQEGIIEATWIPSVDMRADIFTKALPSATANKLIKELGMTDSTKTTNSKS